MAVRELIDKLNCEKKLSHDEWVKLIKEYVESDRAYAAELARGISQEMFGKDIYIRGIVEFSNICKNDCLYCGIRRSNGNVSRYRLTAEEILQCCDEGYGYGFRTFVLQSGEDAFYDREMLCGIVSEIKKRHPDCAVTLSLGEKAVRTMKPFSMQVQTGIFSGTKPPTRSITKSSTQPKCLGKTEWSVFQILKR